MLRCKMWFTIGLCLGFLLLEERNVCGNGVIFPGNIAPKSEVEPESGKRIVGGDDATNGEFPYQVSLRVRGSHFCGGSIISNSFVMTAAHCARATRARIAVYGGSNDLRAMGQPHYVIRRIVHENYRATKEGIPVNDIALLAVAPPLLGSNQQPVSLPQQNQGVAAGTMAVVTGWGTTEESGSVSRILQKVNVPILAKDECMRLLSGLVQNFQICAGYPDTGGKDSCQGDSGGPLVANGQQVGIVSWGNGCARKGFPGVYTEVAAYRNWITSKTGI